MTIASWFFRADPAMRLEMLRPCHAERLAELHAASFARPWSALDMERLLADRAVVGDGLFLGQGRDPSGFVLSRRVLDEAEILSLSLAPDIRGRDHGRMLLTHHCGALAHLGVRVVHLEVEEENAPALALYRRGGFTEVGRRAGYYRRPDGTAATAFTMRLSL